MIHRDRRLDLSTSSYGTSFRLATSNSRGSRGKGVPAQERLGGGKEKNARKRGRGETPRKSDFQKVLSLYKSTQGVGRALRESAGFDCEE